MLKNVVHMIKRTELLLLPFSKTTEKADRVPRVALQGVETMDNSHQGHKTAHENP